jgi:EAL domain-containing protein (putative c-di-GMP-specific phosphodiesterase class I)
MAVNISGRHFHSSERLVDVVERALGVTGLRAELLELEVTEGIAIGEEEATAQALNQIRDLGVKLAIDDFGTGYSMLGRLRSFPIDRLKIDRSFVNEIESHHNDAPIGSSSRSSCATGCAIRRKVSCTVTRSRRRKSFACCRRLRWATTSAWRRSRSPRMP